MILIAISGCDRHSAATEEGEHATNATPKREATEPNYAAIYDRAESKAKKAALFKPAEGAEGRPAELAPLLVYEVTDDFEGRAPVVRGQVGRVRVNGQDHDTVIYRWDGSGAQNGEPFALRLILDDHGYAMIYEVVSPRRASGPRVYFVSRSLEEAAVEQFGGALKGRRFATEPSLETHPDVVVARMLEDGPEPMGPIVLIDAAASDIFSLSCRCMPSQIDALVRTDYYDLVVEAEDDGETPEVIDIPLRLPDEF